MKRLNLAQWAGLLTGLALSHASLAQTPPFTPPTTTLTVTTSTDNVALPGQANNSPYLLLQNTGTFNVSYALGSTSSITAAADSVTPVVQAGGCVVLYTGNVQGFLAGIASGSTTLKVTRIGAANQAPPAASCPGQGGSGAVTGTVTANQGTTGVSPWVVNLGQVAGATVATGHGTAAGAVRVELPTDGTGVVGLNAGTALVGKVGIDQTTQGTTNGVNFAPTAVAGAGIAPSASGAAAASLALKASPGNFYSASAVNLTSTSGFCLVVDLTAAPVTGTAVTPLFFEVLPANGSCSISTLGGPPAVFATGITFLVSSNASPYTFTSGVITAAISGMVK